MKTKFEIDDRRAALAAGGAALAAVTMGTVILADTQSSESTTVGIEHLSAAMFSLALVLMVPMILRLGRRAGGVAIKAATLAAAGQVVLAALATASNVHGEDPSFFAAVAVPANLAIFGGWVTVAVVLARRHAAPAWLAASLPLSYLVMLPGAQLGGAILAGLIWLLLARWLAAGESRTRPATA